MFSGSGFYFRTFHSLSDATPEIFLSTFFFNGILSETTVPELISLCRTACYSIWESWMKNTKFLLKNNSHFVRKAEAVVLVHIKKTHTPSSNPKLRRSQTKANFRWESKFVEKGGLITTKAALTCVSLKQRGKRKLRIQFAPKNRTHQTKRGKILLKGCEENFYQL